MASQLLQAVSVPNQKLVNGGAPLPLILAPREGQDLRVSQLADWIKREKSWIEDQLLKSGAVLLRGCNVNTPEDFNAVVEAFDYEEKLYTGGLAQRSHVVGRVYTANEAPAHVYIPFHHEMAQVPQPPSKIFFFCQLAPTKGGETPLLWSNSVVQRLQLEHPDFLQQLEKKGLLYQIFFSDENFPPNSYLIRCWKTLYKVENRAELEARIAEESEGQMRVEWIDGHGVKILTGPVEALKWDTQRRQEVFFNYMVSLYLIETEVLEKDKQAASFDNVVFGDGSLLPREKVLACQKIMEEEKVEFKWETGDVMLLDNVAVQHSKNPCFSSRRILVSLIA